MARVVNRVDTVSGGIEAVAIKNLQTILRSRGISAEALFSKYDLDGNGSLNLDEFEAALSSITGQKAPGAIVTAIFSVLDSDGNGSIELEEFLENYPKIHIELLNNKKEFKKNAFNKKRKFTKQ